MTSNAERASALVRALRAGVDRDLDALRQCCTEDVRLWTPAFAGASIGDLELALEHRDDAFSDHEVRLVPLDVGGEMACVEWSVSMTHTGPLAVAAGEVVEATGTQVTINGVTVAEFRGDRICSARQYWDELSVFEQLGLVDTEAS